MMSGGCHKAVASEGNHSWLSGVLSVVGSSGILTRSTCIGDPSAVAGWMSSGWIGCSASSAGGKTSVPEGGVGSGERKIRVDHNMTPLLRVPIPYEM